MVKTRKKFLRIASKPGFKRADIIDKDLAIVEEKNTSIIFNKPRIVGTQILWISKLLMYNFHFKHMLPLFGWENVKLLMTDTDSLCYEITQSNHDTMDIWQKLKKTNQIDFR